MHRTHYTARKAILQNLSRVAYYFSVLFFFGLNDLQSTTPPDQFKGFVAAPPFLAEFNFKLRDITTWETQRLETVKFYRCRWQTNGFAFKEVDEFLEVKSDTLRGSDRAMGYFDSDYWMATASQMTTSTCDNPIDETNYLSSTVKAMRDVQLSAAFNFGVPNVPIGTIRWEGNHFSAVTYNGHPIGGDLLIDPDGTPSRMNVVRNLPTGKSVRMFVTYEFATNIGLPFLPSRTRRFTETAEGPKLSAEIELISVETSKKSLPKRLFASDQFSPMRLKYYTEITNGIPSRRELVALSVVQKGRYTTIVVSAVIVVTSFFGVFLLFKERRQSNQTK